MSDIERAREILARLCDKGLVSMSIPVRESDEDMVLSRVIERASMQPEAPQDMPRAIRFEKEGAGRINANDMEAFARKHPTDYFLKGSGVLKLIEAIRVLERKPEAPQAAQITDANRMLDLLSAKIAFCHRSDSPLGLRYVECFVEDMRAALSSSTATPDEPKPIQPDPKGAGRKQPATPWPSSKPGNPRSATIFYSNYGLCTKRGGGPNGDCILEKDHPGPCRVTYRSTDAS